MMAGSIQVRGARVDDVPCILGFIRELAEFERLSDRVLATEALLRDCLFGPHIYAEALIAELDGAAAGFALYFHSYSTFLARPGIYLEDLYVRAGARGHGVGLALLKAVAQLAVERGCARIDWAVLDWNIEAIRFYERIGARPESQWSLYRLTGDALSDFARR